MIRIVTDSMSDIQQEQAKRHGLTVLPQYVLFGEESFLDGVDLTLDQFYQKLFAAKALPKTSQVTPESFSLAFASALRQGDEVICIIGSSKLSGSYQSAMIARDMQPEGAPIFLIDSLGATVSQQILVWEAVRLRDGGEPAASIAQALSALVAQVRLVASVQDLKHLVVGGRLSATTAYIGSTLNLRPLLRLRGGKLEQAGLTHGQKRSFAWMEKQMEEEPRDERFPLYLASTNAPELQGELRAYFEKRGIQNIRTVDAGSIIGTHAGQGGLAIAWVKKSEF